MTDDASELVRLLEEAIAISGKIKQAKTKLQSQTSEEPHLKLHADLLVGRALRGTWALTRERQNLIVAAKGCVDRLGKATDATARLTLIFAQFRPLFEDISEFSYVLDRPKMEPPETGLQGKDFQKDLSARVIAYRKIDRLWRDRLNEISEQSAERHRVLLAEALATARTLLD